jgi:Ca-activated chloride channel family protein
VAIWLRRRPLPFVIAIVVCVLLLTGGLHLLTVEGRGTNSSRHGDRHAAKDCGSGAIAFTLAASSEKAQLIRQLAVDYMSKGHRVDGRCVKVVVVSKSSGEAMATLARGWDMTADGPRPDVWSPASSSWVRLLQQRTVTTDHAAFELIPKDLPSIAATPLVVAMPRPMAEALGWPRKQLGWVDLLALSRDRQGWRALGHSDWGAFKLGKTNPNFSTSGLEATIGAFFAATGSTSDLTVRDVTNSEVRKFVAGVERSVVHYGDTTLTFLSNLQRADDQELGLHYISAVTVEEKSVWDYNQGNPSGDPATLGKHHKPHVPLVAIYPKEGTLFSDNPYVVLPAPWVDDAKRKAAADFLAYLRSGPAQAKFERAAFRNYARQPGPLITKANGLLPRQEIPVLPPPAPAIIDRILVSWAALRKPANLLLVIDVSGSMEDPVEGTGKSKLDLAKQAAISSLSQLTSRDQVGLWIFSTKLNGNIDYRELVGIGPMNGQINGKQRRTLIKAKIQTLSPDGKTGLYDTALASYKFIEDRRSLDSINAVMLLTDGINQDNSGGISLSDLLAALRTDQGDEAVRVFTIAYGSNTDPTVLKRIAQVTNGASYDSSDPTSINRVFTTVISNF